MTAARRRLAALLRRHGEALAALAALVLGLWLLFSDWLPFRLVGVLMAATGAGLLVLVRRRARFRGSGRGPGVVEVREGAIAWFGPRDGGIVLLPELLRVTWQGGERLWLLEDAMGHRLSVPHDARGAEALFDALAGLPGMDLARLSRLPAARGGEIGAVVVWVRPGGCRVLT